MLNSLRDADRAARRLAWMQLGWAIFGMALFAVTNKLWMGWKGQAVFPQVPLLSNGQRLLELDVFGMPAVFICLVLALATAHPRRPTDRGGLLGRAALAVFCVSYVLSVIANQHRLQPWAYLAWLTAVVLLLCRADRAIFLLRLLVISVYLHSAISKADYEFLATLGQTFLKSIGVSLDPGRGALMAAGVFPLAELLIGGGLYFRQSRRWAVCAAVLMHLVLMVILSPWRLRHEPAVLIWNAYFIWQAIVLFGWSAVAETAASASATTDGGARGVPVPDGGRSRGDILATIVVSAAVMLPLLEPCGWFDHWPSWGLYAPRNSRCLLFIAEDAVQKLPDDWRQGLTSSFDPRRGWSSGLEIPLSRQSLRLLSVPIYPQARFQLGVAISIVRRYGLGDEAHVVWESGSSRFSGERQRETLRGLREIEAAAGRFWLNAEPRD